MSKKLRAFICSLLSHCFSIDEGGVKYYTNLEARTHINKERYVSWHACLQAKNKDELLTDDGKLINWNTSFFISIQCCFLSSQCGSTMVIQPYSPCNFSYNLDFIKTCHMTLDKKVYEADLANYDIIGWFAFARTHFPKYIFLRLLLTWMHILLLIVKSDGLQNTVITSKKECNIW